MTKQFIDYTKTIIYKIVCNDLNITDVYVGHTTNFINRKALHKSNCNNINGKSYNLKIYNTIRNNGGWLNWSMIEIEKFQDCNDINGWPPKLPKRINLPIFVPQSSPKRPPQTTQMGVPGKIWGRGQGTPVYPIFCLPI
jgi:hypothetical protein